MAKIVLVHGAFHELWGPHEITARWVPALRDGLWHHAAEITERDVAVAFYGDSFRPDPEVTSAEDVEAAQQAGELDLAQHDVKDRCVARVTERLGADTRTGAAIAAALRGEES